MQRRVAGSNGVSPNNERESEMFALPLCVGVGGGDGVIADMDEWKPRVQKLCLLLVNLVLN
jgi:hypothetical protein